MFSLKLLLFRLRENNHKTTNILFVFISIAADLVVRGTVDLHQFMRTQHLTSDEIGVFNAVWEFG